MEGYTLESLRRLGKFLDEVVSDEGQKARIRQLNRTTNFNYVAEQIMRLNVGNRVIGTGVREVDHVFYEVLTGPMFGDVSANGLGVIQYQRAREIVRELISSSAQKLGTN